YGYALAVFAWLRQEREPAWAAHLRPNVRAVFKEGLAYLFKTGDARFDPEGKGDGRPVAELLAELKHPSAGVRMTAVWGLMGLGPAAAAAVSGLEEALRDSDPLIRRGAAGALGWIGPAAEAAIPALVGAALQGGEPGVSEPSLGALGQLGKRPEVVVPVA